MPDYLAGRGYQNDYVQRKDGSNGEPGEDNDNDDGDDKY